MTTKIIGVHDQEAISAMLDHITNECSAVDTERLYDEMLDECSETCATCKQFGASRILKEMDPTAYRCGMVDYLDGLTRDGRDGLVEINTDYYQMRDVTKAQEEFVDGLKDELREVESEIENLEAEDELDQADTNQLEKLRDDAKRKESAIEACEDHAF